MTWLARLKKTGAVPEMDATKPTKPGFVGSVAPIPAHTRKFEGDLKAANDTADAGPATTPTTTVDKFRAASLALDAVIHPSGVAADKDRCCWPNGTAMTTAELDAFTARLCRFTDKGLFVAYAETLADKLVKRDREGDDRRLCLECTDLAGHAGSWRCGAWKRAGVAIVAKDAGMGGDEVAMLRRCDGFKGAGRW